MKVQKASGSAARPLIFYALRATLVSLIMAIGALQAALPLTDAFAMTGKEIVEKAVKQNLRDTARLSVKITTFKGKKMVADHHLWFAYRTTGDTSAIFIDFDEPKQANGLRFLFRVEGAAEPKAWMYLPATRKTVPLALNDESASIGGTGLTLQDFQAIAPVRDQRETVTGEEAVDGRDCWLIKVTSPRDKDERLLWITKDQFLVVRSRQIGENGKVKRTFKVIEFFRDQSGKEFPREEEITIPAKDIRIRVRQEHALFGIQIPSEVTDPETFGTYEWKH